MSNNKLFRAVHDSKIGKYVIFGVDQTITCETVEEAEKLITCMEAAYRVGQDALRDQLATLLGIKRDYDFSFID